MEATPSLPPQKGLREENTGAGHKIEQDFRERNLAQAEKDLKEALQKNPDVLDYRMDLAQVETMRGNFEEARDNLTRLARQ